MLVCWNQSWSPEAHPCAFLSLSQRHMCAGWADFGAAPSTTSLPKVGDTCLEAGWNNSCLTRSPNSAPSRWRVRALCGGPNLPGRYHCLHLPPPAELSMGLGGDFPDSLGTALSILASLHISGLLCSTGRICFYPEQIPRQSQAPKNLSS